MFNPELTSIKILLDRDTFLCYNNIIDIKYIKDNYRELSYIYNVLYNLHSKYNKSFTVDELVSSFYAEYPDSDRVVYDALFKRLYELQIDPAVGRDTLEAVKRRKALLKLSEAAFKVSQGTSDEDLTPYWESLSTKDDHQAEEISDANATFLEVMENVNTTQGMRWRLDCLNKSLGSLRDGDFGFIFARPETGKTTFLASEVTHFLENASRPVIWIN